MMQVASCGASRWSLARARSMFGALSDRVKRETAGHDVEARVLGSKVVGVHDAGGKLRGVAVVAGQGAEHVRGVVRSSETRNRRSRRRSSRLGFQGGGRP